MIIDPNSIDLATLPSLCLSRRSELPEAPAIYFAIDSLDQIQYIGRSQNLRQRWASHHRHFQLQAIDSVRIAWLRCDDVSLLAEIETALIEWFEPPLTGLTMKPESNATITNACSERTVSILGKFRRRVRKLNFLIFLLNHWHPASRVPLFCLKFYFGHFNKALAPIL
jgi:excinuclease UvrABC nuclease subunit